MHKVIYLLFTLSVFVSIQPLAAQESQKLPVTLEELFKMADENSRTLKISAYNEQLAAEEVQEQKNKLLPSLDATLSFSYNGDGWISDRDFSNGMSVPIPGYGNNFALEATQAIYAGGAIKTAIEVAKLDLMVAQLDKEKNKQDIRFLITGYYLELQKLQNQKQIMEHNIDQTDKLLVQINNKFKEGTALKNAVTRYELQKQSLELALLKLENGEKIINKELVKTLQLPKGTQLAISPSVAPSSATQQASVQWQELALNNAPVLKQMELYLQQAKHGEKLAKADQLPQLFAFAGDKLEGPITIEIPAIDKNFNYWYVGLGVKYNIASLYKSKSKINSSKIATQRAMENNEMVQDQLATDIETALIRYQEAQDIYKTQLKGVQLATENYNVIRNRYVNSLVLITEMLDAENSKIDAEMKAANAQINILYHDYQLRKLAGTL
ncbi:TolC family protein [Pedobacter immunditicola]|uniref:TolC family protein n=1 Tax=Pedobacter immunditicola TaxID=3133440 RepID=UPI00309FC096